MKRSLATPRILIVDDDSRLRSLLQRYLGEQGFEAQGVGTAEQMRQRLQREHVDLLVLDLMLPDEDGLSVCSRLRAEGSDLPILMLTAKGDDVDRIIGLEIGADDYLGKPCNPRELVARIKAILRRQGTQRAGEPQAQGESHSFGSFRLDLGTRRLTRGGEVINLTTAEFGLLSLLVQHPHETLSRDRLLSMSRGRHREQLPFDRSVDVLVSRLRKLLETDPAHPRYIQTVWGVGYVFVPEGNFVKLLPETAFGRIALLIGVLLCITILVAGLVFGRFARQEWMERFAGRIVGEVERIGAEIEREGYDTTAARHGAHSKVSIVRQPPAPPGHGRLARSLATILSEELGESVRVRVSHHPRPVVWVGIGSHPQFWVGVPFGRGWVGPAGRVLLWLAVAVVVVFVGAYLLARQFTRPLEALVSVTDAIGRGEVPPEVDDSGPREVRHLRRALYQAASDQREISRLREQMLAGVSHDLRTPMSRLRIATEMLAGSPRDPELLAGMTKDIEEMDRIIEQFLAWVRDGQDEPAECLAFDELVADCVERFSRLGHTIEFVPGGVGNREVRPLAMRRLISNLLSNASLHGKAPVFVSTGLADGRLVLAVRDSGRGIPTARQEELFRPFATGSESRGETGAGLGLAIVDRVARLHGGTVTLGRKGDLFEVRVELPGG